MDAERLYDAAGPYPLVFASSWALMLTWAAIGLLLGAGFYRSNGSELVAIDLARVPATANLALCLAALLPGAAAPWALVRDMPIRNRVA